MVGVFASLAMMLVAIWRCMISITSDGSLYGSSLEAL